MATWRQLAELSLHVAQVREVDRRAIEQYQMSSLVLMENAALGCAQWLIERFRIPPTVLVLCGNGNNGGDGFAIARRLLAEGWDCRVVGLGPEQRMSEDARANWRWLSTHANTERKEAGVHLVNEQNDQGESLVHEYSREVDVIVDAILGSGAKGDPKEPFATWIRIANSSRAWKVAIDIPTGLDAETGQMSSTVFEANQTLTFVAPKIGFLLPDVPRVLGQVDVLPIGIPAALIEELLVEWRPPKLFDETIVPEKLA